MSESNAWAQMCEWWWRDHPINVILMEEDEAHGYTQDMDKAQKAKDQAAMFLRVDGSKNHIPAALIGYRVNWFWSARLLHDWEKSSLVFMRGLFDTTPMHNETISQPFRKCNFCFIWEDAGLMRWWGGQCDEANPFDMLPVAGLVDVCNTKRWAMGVRLSTKANAGLDRFIMMVYSDNKGK